MQGVLQARSVLGARASARTLGGTGGVESHHLSIIFREEFGEEWWYIGGSRFVCTLPSLILPLADGKQ
jgi:hypothetical protein